MSFCSGGYGVGECGGDVEVAAADDVFVHVAVSTGSPLSAAPGDAAVPFCRLLRMNVTIRKSKPEYSMGHELKEW
jgi:hypothetical protein